MAFHPYIVAADFYTRADAVEAMKQVVAEVTAPSLDDSRVNFTAWQIVKMIQRRIPLEQ